jgi:hypothetical protein
MALSYTTKSDAFPTKTYFSNVIVDPQEITDFFDLPADIVLLIGAKILIKEDTETEAKKILDTLHLTDIEDSNKIQQHFLITTLAQFDQIIKATTYELGANHKKLTQREAALNNLKTKMASLNTISATKATAKAIATATENLEEYTSKNALTELRINNLEHNLKKQEQKTNEMVNKLPKNSKKNQQTQPQKTIKTLKSSKTTKLVDLTTVDDTSFESENEETGTQEVAHSVFPTTLINLQQKKRKQHQLTSKKSTKVVQWRKAEIQQFNPNLPVAMTNKLKWETLLPLHRTTYCNNPLSSIQPPLQHLLLEFPQPR